MKEKVTIVKIGGALLEDPDQLEAFCVAFLQLAGRKIIVHGGGQKASSLSRSLGFEPLMVEGRRITDAKSLEAAVMAYAGWANKHLVSRLQAKGCNALGVSGADGDLIRAGKRPVGSIDYGFVGDIRSVNTKSLKALLQAGFVPCFCALTHDGAGQLLNTNADTIAAELAIALSSEYRSKLYYCFDKAGVLADIEDENSLIRTIDRKTYEELSQSRKIASGMIPKLHNCFHALQEGVERVFIGSEQMLSSPESPKTEITL
ncbi:acetylglutamate kinase [Robiginitalea sp. IMCC44478]|uniref:acetylglutamate kinase n=1 Tax=Robiginitalea sp. IMCC44478 TaxID=3459122 RepID=UPI004042608D